MKENSILLDANIIVALVDAKDVHHKKAVGILQKSQGEFSILYQILAEVYSVISRRCRERKYDCKRACETIEELEKVIEVIPVQFNLYHKRVVDNLKNYPELNYNDWLMVIFALENNFKILSLDKKLLDMFGKLRKKT